LDPPVLVGLLDDRATVVCVQRVSQKRREVLPAIVENVLPVGSGEHYPVLVERFLARVILVIEARGRSNIGPPSSWRFCSLSTSTACSVPPPVFRNFVSQRRVAQA
jgi:hypothetical protein